MIVTKTRRGCRNPQHPREQLREIIHENFIALVSGQSELRISNLIWQDIISLPASITHPAFCVCCRLYM